MRSALLGTSFPKRDTNKRHTPVTTTRSKLNEMTSRLAKLVAAITTATTENSFHFHPAVGNGKTHTRAKKNLKKNQQNFLPSSIPSVTREMKFSPTQQSENLTLPRQSHA